MHKQTVEQSCHSKIILFGEHSCCYNYLSLIKPVTSLHTKTVIKESDGPQDSITTYGYEGLVKDMPTAFGGIKIIIDMMVTKVPTHKPFHMSFESNIPMERGLGSSAAITISTIRALEEYLGIKLSAEETMLVAKAAEFINHGETSGIDVSSVMASSPVAHRMEDGAKEIGGSLGVYLVIADTGVKGNTRKAVALVKAEMDHGDGTALIEKVGLISADGIKAYKAGDAVEFGRLMDEEQVYLDKLHISTPEIAALIAAARSQKALGAKLSGGGLGGVVIALAKDKEQAENIKSAMLKAGAKGIWIENI